MGTGYLAKLKKALLALKTADPNVAGMMDFAGFDADGAALLHEFAKGNV